MLITRVRHERLRRGWSQTALSFHAKVATPDVSRIETGRLRPTSKQAEKLAAALGLDPATLLDLMNEGASPDAGDH